MTTAQIQLIKREVDSLSQAIDKLRQHRRKAIITMPKRRTVGDVPGEFPPRQSRQSRLMAEFQERR